MAKDLIYMVTTVSTPAVADSTVPLTTIARRRGCACLSGTNSVVLNRPGYYSVSGNITFTAPTTGDATIDLYKNGVTVPGMTETVSVTTATTQYRTLSVNGIVRVVCSEVPTTLTLFNSGIGITLTNVALTVEYLG